MKTLKHFLILNAVCLILNGTYANNVSITNTNVSGNMIRFNISWDNSWRVSQPPYSYDAVWVFVKYAECTGGVQVWKHLNLHTDAAQDSSGTDLEIKTPLNADGKCYGVFIQRSTTNMGGPASIASQTVRLTFAPGVPPAGPTYNFRVYGIEMVYTPGGDFQLGDGVSTNTFSSVSSNAALEIAGAADAFAAIGGTGTTTNALPAAYPTGWNTFYCMKYEISQEEYVDFLNVLTYDQQANHTVPPPSTAPNPNQAYALGSSAPYQTQTNRNGIRILTPGINNTQPAIYGCDLGNSGTFNDNDDGQNVACNFLSWADLSAYLDWAALRPMTELEYEKESRGTVTRVANEYPWGASEAGGRRSRYCCSIFYTGSWLGLNAANSSALNSPGFNNELSTSTGNGLCAAGGSAALGPLRVGFAATGSTSRITAGASYYGVLDMGGNVWEHTVSTDANGILFDETAQGNGNLDANGYSDVGTWPPATTALGSGFRGGAWDSQYTIINNGCNCAWYYIYYHHIMISDRTFATAINTTRANSYGGRGVRNP